MKWSTRKRSVPIGALIRRMAEKEKIRKAWARTFQYSLNTWPQSQPWGDHKPVEKRRDEVIAKCAQTGQDYMSLLIGCSGRRNHGGTMLEGLICQMSGLSETTSGRKMLLQRWQQDPKGVFSPWDWWLRKQWGLGHSRIWRMKTERVWIFLTKQLKKLLTYCLQLFCVLFWERTWSKELALQSQRSGFTTHTEAFLCAHAPKSRLWGWAECLQLSMTAGPVCICPLPVAGL